MKSLIIFILIQINMIILTIIFNNKVTTLSIDNKRSKILIFMNIQIKEILLLVLD
jgi:hypothetical protein